MRIRQEASIELVDVDFKIRIHADRAPIQLENGQTRIFDTLYCLIGSGKVITDAHQQTSVSGLYASGDVTSACVKSP
jgi:thioredoxin reductase